MDVLKDAIKIAGTETEEIIVHQFADSEIAFFTSKKPKRESENEDALTVIPVSKDCCVLVVSDGLGGHSGGHKASKITIDCLVSALKETKNVRESIISAIEKAHKEIKELKVGAGATVSIAEISKSTVRFYNVGDSASFLISGKGTVKYKTIEQSPVGYGVESGLLEEDQALEHEHSHYILGALGHGELRLELSEQIPMSPRDLILVATDGLTGNISSDILISHITKGSIEERVKHIVEVARSQMEITEGFGAPDDLTMILFKSQG